jgi:hypothetical protein
MDIFIKIITQVILILSGLTVLNVMSVLLLTIISVILSTIPNPANPPVIHLLCRGNCFQGGAVISSVRPSGVATGRRDEMRDGRDSRDRSDGRDCSDGRD